MSVAGGVCVVKHFILVCVLQLMFVFCVREGEALKKYQIPLA